MREGGDMIQKNFQDISKTDIDFLIENKISEIKTLEYKERLPGPQDSDKKEFLADISSFANASGGDVIYGIKELRTQDNKKTGEPEAVVPIQDVTSDEAIRKIENLIRDGIEPRMSVHVKAINGYGLDCKGFIVLVHIPKSFASPHMVKFKGTSRFYSRTSAGKNQLDVHEIRSAFLATDSQAERIRSFIQNRISKIIADETPVPLSTAHRLILHIVPLMSFLNHQRLQINYETISIVNYLPIGASGCDHRYNLDGFLTYDKDYENQTLNDGYCQVFFDGVIESVYSDILTVNGGRKPQKGETGFIASVAYEKYIIEAIQHYIKGYKAFGIETPIIISMALLGCKGAYLYVGNFNRQWQPIDRDIVIFPEVQVESLDVPVTKLMKPIFDAVWNACGYPHSCNYDDNGNWNPR